MKTITLFLLLTFCFSAAHSQRSMELSFTGIDSVAHLQLDSIKIINYTHGGDTMLYWPDTVLAMYILGIKENIDKPECIIVKQNYPNPVVSNTYIDICLPEKSTVKLLVTDALGRQVLNKSETHDKGCHTFRFTPGNADIYFLTVLVANEHRSIKLLNASVNRRQHCELDYVSTAASDPGLKATKNITSFQYELGDLLLFIAYSDTLESGDYDNPIESMDYTLQFANNTPCIGLPILDYEGQSYATIQVANQCWMKENLNVGEMLSAPEMPSNNDIIEKYCMGNYSWICDEAGGMYFWNEMMNYINLNGGQGICPDGWHIPTDLDWQILEGTVDSEFGIGDSQWDMLDWRGENAGGMLKLTGFEYWEPPNTGATDSYDYSALAGGYYVQQDFWGPGYKGLFWSSDPAHKYFRHLDWDKQQIERGEGDGALAISVRCVKDQNYTQSVLPIYLLGNGTTVGWDNYNALPMAWMGEGNYARVETLTAGTDHFIKFISDLGQWAPQWGTNGSGTSEAGPLVYRPTEEEPDPEAIPVGETGGDYYIEADTSGLEYKTFKTSGELYILGDATSAEWDTDQALQMSQDIPHVFTIEIPLYGGKLIKFIDVLGSWDQLWGTDDSGTQYQGPMYYSEGMAFPYPKELPGPDYDGLYLVTVDMRTMEYTITEK